MHWKFANKYKYHGTKIANRLKVIQKLSRTNQTDTGLNQLIVWGIGDLYYTIIHIVYENKNKRHHAPLIPGPNEADIE
jgi:hypothetical protein